MPAKRIIIALLIILVAVGGFVAGLVLLRQRQSLNEQAAVPGGQAEVSISPSSGNYKVGDTVETTISFNPANISISGVAVRLTYPFTGTTPEIGVESIDINSALTSSGDWTCPTQTSSQQGTNMIIDIACANTSASGFTANTDTLLARVKLKVNTTPATQPFILRFDPALSVITRKSDNQDILLIPTSTGSFTVGGPVQSPTPTLKVSPTVTPKVTSKLSPTKAVTGAVTITPTKVTSLPETGVSYPTIFGLGLGIMVIVGALFLAI
jgi:hypothetical protein